MTDQPQAAPESGVEIMPLGLFLLSTAVFGGSILVLWLGTSPWTDYAFIVMFCLAVALFFVTGTTWVDRHFAARAKRLGLTDNATG